MKESFFLERGYPLENMYLGPPHKRPFDIPEKYNAHFHHPPPQQQQEDQYSYD